MSVYCLDANVFIEGWSKYYAPEICPHYWDWLLEQAQAGHVFAPAEVYRELDKKTDALAKWAKEHKEILFREAEIDVILAVKEIMANPLGQRLVDNTKGRSLADPWVIAHAQVDGAIVVTKEECMPSNSSKVKIPNVCNALQIPWCDDFQFLKAAGFRMARG